MVSAARQKAQHAAQVGARIKQLRQELKLSQRALSGPNCTAAFISRVEAGERLPSITKLRYLAERLGTTPEYLETGHRAIVTLMLDDFAPYLETAGFDPETMTHAQVAQLSAIFVNCVKDGSSGNPLHLAVIQLRRETA